MTFFLEEESPHGSRPFLAWCVPVTNLEEVPDLYSHWDGDGVGGRGGPQASGQMVHAAAWPPVGVPSLVCDMDDRGYSFAPFCICVLRRTCGICGSFFLVLDSFCAHALRAYARLPRVHMRYLHAHPTVTRHRPWRASLVPVG